MSKQENTIKTSRVNSSVFIKNNKLAESLVWQRQIKDTVRKAKEVSFYGGFKGEEVGLGNETITIYITLDMININKKCV